MSEAICFFRKDDFVHVGKWWFNCLRENVEVLSPAFHVDVASVEGALAVLQAARDSTSLAWCTLRDPWILGHKGNLLQYATVKILY